MTPPAERVLAYAKLKYLESLLVAQPRQSPWGTASAFQIGPFDRVFARRAEGRCSQWDRIPILGVVANPSCAITPVGVFVCSVAGQIYGARVIPKYHVLQWYHSTNLLYLYTLDVRWVPAMLRDQYIKDVGIFTVENGSVQVHRNANWRPSCRDVARWDHYKSRFKAVLNVKAPG